ncbi:uncharacterized protein LOC121730961 isoform X2 [Aricia agestis]|uniref:uncharacterized protein LOC121730961 isoform X2 n=1 Tax=Aricia agestis TaxID=91739 RepID=UPI001C205112|nr:uncharacterized protein LOC121730961 isoform X2 [Aricia agestis]
MAKRRNLDVYLQQVSEQFITIKYDDFKRSQEVFKCVFDQIKKNMEKQCNYFKKYASQVTYGGSVSDGIKVGRLDEFDMDIVIRLPVSYGDGDDGIIVEPDRPGFVRLKIHGFDHLDKQKDWESSHKVTRDWRDTNKYLLQNKFRFWLNSVVQKALNDMDYKATVGGKTYILKYKSSGPAYTLLVRNSPGEEAFVLDIDLVPVIRFILPRWPPGYRKPRGHRCTEWFVVPKPNKAESNAELQNRAWRLSFQDFEREMIKDCKNLKFTIRLLKKLRDAQGMKPIASYYIKTLFLWKIEETNNKRYWETKLSVLFRDMVQKLHDAIQNKNIPYFWDQRNNLIENLKPSLQAMYVEKLSTVLESIDNNDAEKTAFYLLTPQEQTFFRTTPFYRSVNGVDSKAPVLKYNSNQNKMIRFIRCHI